MHPTDMRSVPHFRPARSWAISVTAALVAVAMIALPAPARENLLADPGFEQYRLNAEGRYVLPDDAPWREITMGRGSVTFNASEFEAPRDMLRERPQGFSPATTRFVGTGPEENTGRIILQQDVIAPSALEGDDLMYEAWVWLGGAGRDDDNGQDLKEEAGGWEIFFYSDTDRENWKESDVMEYHRRGFDFYGQPNTFVPVVGFGKVPRGAKAFRMRVWASTWSTGAGPRDYTTEVAVDNAHFAIIRSPNMLINGDFELDVRPGEFKGWRRPADWPFSRNGLKPLDVDNVFGENFDHGTYRPFYGGKYAYGYVTYLSGWGRDAFSFSQTTDYDLPAGTPLVLMFNWIQHAAHGGEAQLRIVGTQIQGVIEFLRDGKRVGAEGFWYDWPVPVAAANVCRYDQNSDQPFSPRVYLEPPAGTDKLSVNINFIMNMPYKDGWRSVNAAVDDFLLVPVDEPRR